MIAIFAVALCVTAVLAICVPIGVLYWIHFYRTMTDSKKPSPLQ